MAPKFVAAYRKGGKNDGNDAETICEAVGRPGMRFVPVKSDEQQAILSLHRVRQGLIKERTALINQLRGLLSEFGLIMPKGRYRAQHRIPDILEDAENGLPMLANRAKNNRDSERGKLYAFLTVGPNPRTSTVVRMTTAHNGSDVTYQSGKEDIAETKNNQSVFVIVMSARFT